LISCLDQRRNDAAQGFERGGHVGIFSEFAAVMQADDAAIADSRENALRYGRGGELPVEPADGPHDAPEPEFRLHLADAGPALAIGRAHHRRAEASGVFDDGLGIGEVAFDQLRRFQGEVDVGMGVITDFVALRQNLARDLRMPFDVYADLKEGSGYVMLLKDVQNVGRGGRGAVVEGERDGFAAGLAAPEGIVEYEGGPSAYRPGCRGNAGGQSSRHCNRLAHFLIARLNV